MKEYINLLWIWLKNPKKTKGTIIIMCALIAWNVAAILLGLASGMSESMAMYFLLPGVLIQMLSITIPIPFSYLILTYIVARIILELFLLAKRKLSRIKKEK